jgi:hypothetical protein
MASDLDYRIMFRNEYMNYLDINMNADAVQVSEILLNIS